MFNFLKRLLGGPQPHNPYELPIHRANNTEPSAEQQPPPIPPTPAPADPTPPNSPEQQIEQAIAAKKPILAIKILLRHTDIGLAEAKRAIDRGTWRSLLHHEHP